MISRYVRVGAVLVTGVVLIFLARTSWDNNTIVALPTPPDTTPAVQDVSGDWLTNPSLSQDDPRLLDFIRKHHLKDPSPLPYNLKSKKGDDTSMGQAAAVAKLLNTKKKGFFFECGALDGETRSNTLNFEREFGWEGVLVEGDPKNSKLMRGTHRKAYTVDACLSPVSYPIKVDFMQSFNLGRIEALNATDSAVKPNHVLVQCFPLASILFALNRTSVNYLSLDVEGNELEVLRTIPWKQVHIQTLSVEFYHVKEGKDAMKKYMQEQGYSMVTEVKAGGWANDFIFLKNEKGSR